jgi:hypothetical protein
MLALRAGCGLFKKNKGCIVCAKTAEQIFPISQLHDTHIRTLPYGESIGKSDINDTEGCFRTAIKGNESSGVMGIKYVVYAR